MGSLSALATVLLACSAHASVVTDHVERALSAANAARSYSEWQASGTTPDDVIAEVAAIGTPGAWSELCGKLTSLKDEDLALFEHAIGPDSQATGLDCRLALEKRLTRYWERESRSLHEFHHGPELELNEIGPGPAPAPAPAPPAVPVLGPSDVHVIEAAKGPVFFDGNLKHGEIALTFDDGPHPTRTQKILDTLKRAGIRATFFEVGEMAKRNPQLSKLVVDAGHTVGSHTWDHPQLPKLAPEAAEHDIMAGYDAVMAATGIKTPFFRFPYGARNKPLQTFVQGLNWASFFWNMDSLDWKLRNPTDLFKNVLAELNREKGGIILFHDIQEQTTIVLPHVLEELKARNFKTVVFVPQDLPPKP